jgi:hypothetical protein|tara:strand:- start:1502 stop:1810 length:309 start_codon:yes stop_codon:yes gene_type:complete
MANSKKTEAEAVNEEVATAETEAPAEGSTPESIGLQDLQLLAQIVDLASQRGAFRGNEMTQVGTVFDKLTTFLNFVADQNAANEEAEADSEAEAPAEAPTGE